jgi:hypothetical protein
MIRRYQNDGEEEKTERDRVRVLWVRPAMASVRVEITGLGLSEVCKCDKRGLNGNYEEDKSVTK